VSKFIDLIGQRYGKLIVKNRADSSRSGQSRWNCKCDCGNIKVILGDSLRSGKTKSCGCLQKESVKSKNTIHGHKQRGKESNTYVAWRSMLDRCNNSKNKRYKDYGGRGITVCYRWLSKNNGFINFLNDMGECPKGYSIDRINNDILINGYSPNNCRWTTRKENNRNKRNNCTITYNGKTQCLTIWAEEYGLSVSALWARLYVLNWSIEKALLTPVKKYKRK
jgi:hypothetical protein